MNLQHLREQIDVLDQKILSLLNERARLAIEIGHYKMKNNHSEIYDPAREQEIITKVTAHNTGPLQDDHIAHIFKLIMTSCRSLEYDIK